MTGRSFAADDLVQLPRLNAEGVVALGAEIATAARGLEDVPRGIKTALAAVAGAHGEVVTATAGKLLSATGAGLAATRVADQNLDAAWSATFGWASGWAALPLPENAAVAARAEKLLGVLYPDGLKFTQLSFKLEWAESQARLDAIDAGELDAVFEALGGGAFVRALRKTHRAYGEALGVTRLKEARAAAPDVRRPMDAFYSALRTLVVRVSAHVDPADAASVALADRLLGPIANAESRASATGGEGADAASGAASGATGGGAAGTG